MKRSHNNHREIWRSRGFGAFLCNLKRNRLWLRRIAFLWVIVVALEFFCPVFDCPEEYNLSAENLTHAASTMRPDLSESSASSILTINSGRLDQTFDSFQAIDSASAAKAIINGNTVHCADECLCHAVAIPSLAFKSPDHFSKPEFVRIPNIDKPTLALPPPFEPPKSA